MQRRKLFSVALSALLASGCARASHPPGVQPKAEFSYVLGTHRARFGPSREVVTHDAGGIAVWGGHREWEASVDVVDGARVWKTRCALRPVRNEVLVPNTSAANVDHDPELVCWTLSDAAPFELAIVLERPVLTGYVVFGTRRLVVSPGSDPRQPHAIFSLDRKVVAIVDPWRGCASELYYDDALADDVKTAIAFAATVLVWSEPYTSGLKRSAGC
jgi:hypothetical protein